MSTHHAELQEDTYGSDLEDNEEGDDILLIDLERNKTQEKKDKGKEKEKGKENKLKIIERRHQKNHEEEITIENEEEGKDPQSKASPKNSTRFVKIKAKAMQLWRDYRFVRTIPSIILCLALWFVPLPSASLAASAVHVFAVFLAVILAFLTQPYPMSITVLIGLLFLALTKSFMCTTKEGLEISCSLCGQPTGNSDEDIYHCNGFKGAFETALEGYSNTSVWLVFAAFQLGYAVQVTGLGRRISLLLIKYLGRSLLGLGYAVCASELLLGPFIPSNTARGSVILAIVASICQTLGSTPTKNPRSGGGEYLMLVGAHANLIAASTYQTGMAANPLISEKAEEILGVSDWLFAKWLMGSCVPALVAALVLPLVLKLVSKASVDVTAVRKHVQEQLVILGPLKKQEKFLLFVLFSCLVLWVTSTWSGLDSTFIALLGVVTLVVTNTITWNDLLKNEDAWDTTIWLGGLVLMAEQLTAVGMAAWIGELIGKFLTNVSPIPAALILGIFYFYSMYFFCSLTGHIVAFVGPFLEAGKTIGIPSYLLLAIISYFSTLCGCLTNYSSGPIVLYFGQKYSTTKFWFSIGFMMSLLHIAIWFLVGMGWWKILSWY